MRDLSLSELRKIEQAYLCVLSTEVNESVELNDSMWMDWYEGNDKGYPNVTVYDVISEFMTDKQNGKKKRSFQLIPAAQYLNALKRFMRQGPEMFDFPDSILDEWLYIIFMNASYIEIMTELAGHSSSFPSYELEDIFLEEGVTEVDDWSDYGKASEYLDSIGFYDWSSLPDGSDPWSDYGLKPLYDIMQSIPINTTPSEKIVAINRCLDVCHCRGDLSSAFIEGGKKTCSMISNG